MSEITVLPYNKILSALPGDTLHALLSRHGLMQEAPCGGQGTCGKCAVTVDGQQVLACRTAADRDMTVTVPSCAVHHVLTDASVCCNVSDADGAGYRLAVDIGTTTLAACLMNGATGAELCSLGMLNPQCAYGADVVSRLRHAKKGYACVLRDAVRSGVDALVQELCIIANISSQMIEAVCIVGNPTMQQLFLDIPTDNLTCIPFAPALTKAEWRDAAEYLPSCANARMQIVPDISAYVGADTVACILATGMDRSDALTLLIDIGTNGEMVLGNRKSLISCSTAAGPALEGANIRFGMRARSGAISRVSQSGNGFQCGVIGGGVAEGICGSGLIDAIAAALDAGILNERGKIMNSEGRIDLTERVFLTQADIREVQMAKGAIAAGVELITAKIGVRLDEIERVYLAGAFGSFLSSRSACRIGLIPSVLEHKITAVGNAALAGAKLMACEPSQLARAQDLSEHTKSLSLAELSEFARCYARNMRF